MKSIILFACAFALALSVAGAPAARPAAAPADKPAEPGQVAVPKSAFVIPASPSEGRDPFFPESMRLFASQMKAAPAGGAARPAPAAVLVLRAISVSGARRVATINNRPFEAGEEGEVVAGNSRLRVRCVEISDGRVLIEVEGQLQELRLRPGL